jgi:hypothetical protein
MCATVWNSASSRLVPASSLHPCSWAAPSGLCCPSCAAAPTSPNALSFNPTLQMHPCHFVLLLTCRLAYNIHLMLHQQRHRNQPAAKAWPHGPISLMRNRAGGVACRPDSLVQQCQGAQLVVIKLQPEAGQGRAGQGRAAGQRAHAVWNETAASEWRLTPVANTPAALHCLQLCTAGCPWVAHTHPMPSWIS